MGNLVAPSGGGRAGDVKYVAANSIPSGWFKANGASVNRTTYSALFAVIGTTYGFVDAATFNLPDLRGEFLRAFDDARGTDPARVFGSAQAGQSDGSSVQMSGSFAAGTAMRTYTGAEVRPRNIALLACIKY